MEKFQMDLNKIARTVNPDVIPLKPNKHRIVRVAFDLFRIDGDETDDLWQVQADDDGNEFLVRTYSLPEDNTDPNWSVKGDREYANLTVSFRNIPILRLASKDYSSYSSQDGKILRRTILRKLSSDGNFVLSLISSIPREKRLALKQAGFLSELKDWLESKDIEKSLIEKITDIVEEEVPRGERNKECPMLDFARGKGGPWGRMEEKMKAKMEENAEDEWKLAFLNLHLTKSANCGHCEQKAEEESYKEMFDDLLDSFKSEYDVGELNELPEGARKELFDEADSRWTSEQEQDLDEDEFEIGEEELEEIEELSPEELEELPPEKQFVEPEKVKKILEEAKTLVPTDFDALMEFLKS